MKQHLKTDGFVAMIVDRYKYFRWTPRTAGVTIAYVIVVPALFGYLGFATDVSKVLYHLSGYMEGNIKNTPTVSDRKAYRVQEQRRNASIFRNVRKSISAKIFKSSKILLDLNHLEVQRRS